MSRDEGHRRDSEKESAAALKRKLLLKFGIDQFVGESESFSREITKIAQYSSLEGSVLITGETGTGKESVARAIHYMGCRSEQPFIPINCGSIPDNLFENEMFGHERGAYTDAGKPEAGLVFEAEGGTLFLDEINTLSQAGQVKLLRLLEERKFKPLGSSKYLTANVRFIAATNVDLRKQVESKHFREDLFYRLNLLTIHLPPLRDRGDDLITIAGHFLAQFSKLHARGEMHFSQEAIPALMNYNWPGNIRELKNVIERLVITFRSPMVLPQDLGIPLLEGMHSRHNQKFRDAKRAVLDEFERKYLLQALEENDWNVTKAAESAGKDRRSFQRLLRKYKIESAAV